MTTETSQEYVVVASDGSPAALRGVAYATFEAKRLGVGLKIVHVVPAYLPTGPVPLVPDGSLQLFGHSALERSVEVARDTKPEVHVVSRLLLGSRVGSIIEAASDAPLLVLGARALTLGERVWTGATVAGVCSRARCPVLVVPEDWAVKDTAGISKIVVGFKSPKHAAELLASALELANDLDAEVSVLHAWRLPPAYDDIVTNQVAEEQWAAEQTAVIQSVLDQIRDTYPEVKLSIEVVHDLPAHALTEASRTSDRLLITRPVHGGYLHHLGAVARAVLREAHCPVEVVSPVAVRDETAGPVPESGVLHR